MPRLGKVVHELALTGIIIAIMETAKLSIIFFLTVFMMLLVGCATSLTPKAQALTVINSSSSELASDCKRLGTVTGYAQPGWGMAVGLSQAFNDARNKAAEYPNADTLAIASQQMYSNGGEVSGFVYNCAEKRIQLTQKVNPQLKATQPTPNDVFELAHKCQNKGGVWINDQCVINIE